MTGIIHSIYSACYQSTKTAVIASNTSNVNAAALFGTTQFGVVYKLTINSGVYVYSTSTGTPALDMSSFASGAILQIINNGTISGMGGAGGAGVVQSSPAGSGSAGGDAIKVGVNSISVDNTNGFIYGGGGGGGAGGDSRFDAPSKDITYQYYSGGGGGGGGHSGLTNSSGGAGASPEGSELYYQPGANGASGSAGTNSSGGAGGAGGTALPWTGAEQGVGGAGGTGGDYGAAGNNGQNGQAIAFLGSGDSAVNYTGGSGGAAGNAVRLNGKSITWLGGNDGTHVKGAVS